MKRLHNKYRTSTDINGGIRQKKSLGQVFLNTKWPVEKIVKILQDEGITRVLEIGPGNGILSHEVHSKGIKITCVEKDDRFSEKLSNDIAEQALADFEVVNIDVTKFDLGNWIAQYPGDKIAIIGNIPYNISTPILMWALPYVANVRCLVFMVQLEFAKRLTSQPDTKDYGSLTVFTRLRATPTFDFEVKKSCFSPQPKVDSAVISIRPLSEGALDEETLQRAEKLCRVVFTQRRKKIRNGLKPFLNRIEPASIPFDLDRRPETLNPHEFVELAKIIFS